MNLNKIKNKLICASGTLLSGKVVYASDRNWLDDTVDNKTVTNRFGATNQIKDILSDVLGFARWAGLAICVIMLVWCAVKLATSAGNMQKRAIAMDGIKNVLIATAIIGSATVLATIAYGILKSGNSTSNP